MKQIIFFIILFFSIGVSAQNLTEDTEAYYEKILSNNDNLTDEPCDTLLSEKSEIYFLRRSPIQSFKRYTALFKDSKEVLVYMLPSSLGFKGYNLTWKIKNNKLYLYDISWKRYDIYKEKKNGEFKMIKGKEVSYKKAKKRLEKLTGRKFNKEGLLLADWITDTISVFKYQPYVVMALPSEDYVNAKIFLENNQIEYVLELDKGNILSFKKNDNLKTKPKPYSELYNRQ